MVYYYKYTWRDNFTKNNLAEGQHAVRKGLNFLKKTYSRGVFDKLF
nr:MAG TPA: hypothetical protein [Crassvirales sp.]